MLDNIGRAFPSKYQLIFIKLILSILIIIFEISLSQIHFFISKNTIYFVYFHLFLVFRNRVNELLDLFFYWTILRLDIWK